MTVSVKGALVVAWLASVIRMVKLAGPLAQIGANKIFSQGSETDVGQLEKDGVPTMALIDDAVLDVPVEDCSICACANIALIAFAGSFAPDALADAD